MLYVCTFGSGYMVIWDDRGVVWFGLRAQKEFWRENPFLTTTATLCKGVLEGGIREYRDNCD